MPNFGALMSVEIYFENIDQVVDSLNLCGDKLESEFVPAALDEMGQDLTSLMKFYMHTITSRMKDSTTGKLTSNTEFKVHVDVPYAQKENARRGSKISSIGTGQGTPHNFVNRSLTETEIKWIKLGDQKLSQFMIQTLGR